MIRRRWAGAFGALALTAAFTATGATPAPAAAQPMIGCSTTTGVVLAVDFSHWGGPLLRACGTTPTTGYALLNEGGWRTTGTQHDGPGFICRIGYSGYRGGAQYPTASQDDCVLTPPASAYWSYWHADPGQRTWSYSRLGVMSYRPKPGSVDLWVFGATNTAGTEGRPTFSPDLVRARNTAPGTPGSHTPTPTRTPAPGNPAGSGGTPGGSAPGRHGPVPAPSVSASGGASAKPSAPASASAPGSATPPAPATALAGPSASTRIVDAAPTTAARGGGGGSSTPTLIAVAAVAVLGGAAGLAAWRRKRAA